MTAVSFLQISCLSLEFILNDPKGPSLDSSKIDLHSPKKFSLGATPGVMCICHLCCVTKPPWALCIPFYGFHAQFNVLGLLSCFGICSDTFQILLASEVLVSVSGHCLYLRDTVLGTLDFLSLYSCCCSIHWFTSSCGFFISIQDCSTLFLALSACLESVCAKGLLHLKF